MTRARVVDCTQHLADKPSWDCLACGKPWPCDPARESMVAEYGQGVGLAMLAWQYLEEAVGDMPEGPPAELFERFIRWTHPGSGQRTS